jgi:hypothetical protein
VVRDPRRIRGGEFSFSFMLAIWFYLGFLYTTFHFFLFPEYLEEFHAGSEFWLHSLYGGTSGLAGFLMAGVGGYWALRFLGVKVNYRRWEALLFPMGFFLFLLPLLTGALFLLVGLTDPMGRPVSFPFPLLPKRVMGCVLVAMAVGILLFLRIFRSLGLGPKGLVLMALAVPVSYSLLEKTFFLFVEKVLFPLGFVTGSAQYLGGVGWGLLEGGVAWVIRENLK